jgi:nicotinamidase-related amidase
MSDATPTVGTGNRITLSLRTRVETFEGSGRWYKVIVQDSIAPDESALLICDMWDTHWCKTAAERANVLAERIDAAVKDARRTGVQIIHSPSGTLEFYVDAAQRQTMASIPSVDLPEPLDLPDPALPIDDSDGGCDTGECKRHRPWTRQHPAIEITGGDVISDDGAEVYALMHRRGIKSLFFTGVHINMCVLNRSFGIKQMTRWGVNCLMVRDLTDSMYNPKRSPYVSHDRGTELVIEHIEKHWCPTVTSGELTRVLTG